MSTILLTWELGGGLGHLVNLLPLAKGLAGRGHRVLAALRDLSQAGRIFAGLDIAFLQAPTKTRRAAAPIEPPRTFAHILHNNGFADPDELRMMTAAWRNLYEAVKPDLIVFDHSPTALLAARASPARRVLVGKPNRGIGAVSGRGNLPHTAVRPRHSGGHRPTQPHPS